MLPSSYPDTGEIVL